MPQTQIPKPKTQNPKPKTQNPNSQSLTALKMDGLIVVISPLLVLMHDQVRQSMTVIAITITITITITIPIT